MRSKITDTLSKLSFRFAFLAALIAIPATVSASEHGHTPSISDLKYFWINFLIYSIGLFLILRKPLKKTWLDRRDLISNAINAAKLERDAAHAELAAAQSKLSGLSAEISKLNSDIEREGQRESDEILNEAAQKAQRSAAQAKTLAEGERKSTEALLRKEMVDLAIQKAEEKLRKELSASSDKPLRDVAVSSVQSLVQ